MPLVTLLKKLKMHGNNLDLLVLASHQVFLSVIAGKGILSSAIATGVLGFVTTILFLFCTPSLDVLFSLQAPQPFVQLYALALGKNASVFMTLIAVVGLILVSIHAFLMEIKKLIYISEYQHSYCCFLSPGFCCCP